MTETKTKKQKKCNHILKFISKRICDNYNNLYSSTQPTNIHRWLEYEFYCEKCGEVIIKKYNNDKKL
jgi:hypothetical protein